MRIPVWSYHGNKFEYLYYCNFVEICYTLLFENVGSCSPKINITYFFGMFVSFFHYRFIFLKMQETRKLLRKARKNWEVVWFFFYLGFLSWTFTNHRTAGKGEGISLTLHWWDNLNSGGAPEDAWIQNFRMSKAKIKIFNSKIHHSTRKTDNHHFALLEGSMITFDEWKYVWYCKKYG